MAAELARVTDRLRRSADGLRWAKAETWHVTLQFLGSTTDEQYRCLIERLAELQFPPVAIRLGGLGVFERAGIFHAEVEVTPQLAALQQRVVAATALCGFEPEARPYHPHITLARSKGANRVREIRALQSRISSVPKFQPFTDTEFLVYESHLAPSGSIHEVRHRFLLRGEG